LSRPVIVDAAPSVLEFSTTREETMYTNIQNAAKPRKVRELSMSEIYLRRFLVALQIGDQGDCDQIDTVVQETIARDSERRSKFIKSHPNATQAEMYAYYFGE